MTVSGIVIRTDGPAALASLQPLLAAEPRCQPGPSDDGAQAAVLEFHSFHEARDLHAWLLSLPGVRGVDVVRSETDDEADPTLSFCEVQP